MTDFLILVPASTRPFEDMEDGRPSPRKYARRVTALPSIQFLFTTEEIHHG